MDRLLAIVVSWNRPQFLQPTLDSLFEQLREIPSDVVVVDNGSDPPTQKVIRQENRLHSAHLLDRNHGINGAIETALNESLSHQHRWILISDADMEYRQPVLPGAELMENRPQIGAVSLQHSPEHPAFDELLWNNRTWPLKWTERGCSLLFRTSTLQRMRPLPVELLADFDWWVCRDAPQSLQACREPIAIQVGGARHLGWRAGDSTWQPNEIQEYPKLRV